MPTALTVTDYRKILHKGVVPAENRAVVKLYKRGETTKGGIVLPDQAREQFQTGVILDMGPSHGWPEGLEPGWRVAIRGPAFEGVMLAHGADIGILAVDSMLAFMPPDDGSADALADWRETVPQADGWGAGQWRASNPLPPQVQGAVGARQHVPTGGK